MKHCNSSTEAAVVTDQGDFMSIVEQKVDADSEHQILSRWEKRFSTLWPWAT